MIGSYPTTGGPGSGPRSSSVTPVPSSTWRSLPATVVTKYGAPEKHTHALPMTWRRDTDTVVTTTLGHGWKSTVLLRRRAPYGAFYQDYKAMVGAFWLRDPHHQWYLGMDPRPKTRAFRFWHQGGGHVLTDVLCVKSRTGKQIKPGFP